MPLFEILERVKVNQQSKIISAFSLRTYVKEGPIFLVEDSWRKLFPLVFFALITGMSYIQLSLFQLPFVIQTLSVWLLNILYGFLIYFKFLKKIVFFKKENAYFHFVLQDVVSRLIFQSCCLQYGFLILNRFSLSMINVQVLLILASLMVQCFFSIVRFDLYLYLVVGGLTTLVSISSFAVSLNNLGEKNYALVFAQTVSFFLATLFAFLGQKYFVFDASKSTDSLKKNSSVFESVYAFIFSFLVFLFSRLGFSFIFEFFLLYLWSIYFPSLLIVGKIFFAFVVLVLNYLLSKHFIFKKKGDHL